MGRLPPLPATQTPLQLACSERHWRAHKCIFQQRQLMMTTFSLDACCATDQTAASSAVPPAELRVHAACRKLEVLQDRAEPQDFKEVQLAVMQQLGAPIQDLFAEFEPDARAAASLAQVNVHVRH